MLWILLPLIAFIIFGHYVHKKAERLRAEEPRAHVMVSIALAGEGMASREELEQRNAIEEEIVKRGLGIVDDSGSGGGTMFLRVATTDAQRAVEEIRLILASAGVRGVSPRAGGEVYIDG